MPRTNALASRVKTTGDRISGNIAPDTDAALDFGTNSLRFSNIYLKGSLISSSSSQLEIGQAGNRGSTTRNAINDENEFFPVQAPTASAPSYIVGAMYYDTTLKKLRIGGAAGWETITSV